MSTQFKTLYLGMLLPGFILFAPSSNPGDASLGTTSMMSALPPLSPPCGPDSPLCVLSACTPPPNHTMLGQLILSLLLDHEHGQSVSCLPLRLMVHGTHTEYSVRIW